MFSNPLARLGASWRPRWRTAAPRLLLIGIVAAALFTFYLSGGSQWLHPEYLSAKRATLELFVRQHYAAALLLAALAYLLMAALSIPGGALLSLLIGLLFGRWVGTLVIVIAATLGAAVIFLLARYLIGGWVRERLGRRPQAARLLAGFERDAFHYLLFVRLVPLFPFWLVNLASAFTAIRLPQYVFATAIGIIPGSFIYANLGQTLGRIESLHGLLSPPVIFALTLLGAFALLPLVLRRRGRPSRAGE